MWLLIARVACRGWDGEGDICTHTGPSGAAWCTVEREYKRLKAKRKQTGSSSSKPNSGGVKLRCALSGARKLSSLCFPLYFHITSLNAPLNSKRRESRVQFQLFRRKERKESKNNREKEKQTTKKSKEKNEKKEYEGNKKVAEKMFRREIRGSMKGECLADVYAGFMFAYRDTVCAI